MSACSQLWDDLLEKKSYGSPLTKCIPQLTTWHPSMAVHLNRLALYLVITKDEESWRVSTVMGAEGGDLYHLACTHSSFWFLLPPTASQTPSMRLPGCIKSLLSHCVTSSLLNSCEVTGPAVWPLPQYLSTFYLACLLYFLQTWSSQPLWHLFHF